MQTNLNFSFIFFAILICVAPSCKESAPQLTVETPKLSKDAPPKKELSKEFKDYWYAGDAEITSYKLKQARYGEMREGNAVLIYVTEPFLNDKQVKADNSHPDNVPMLKLNATKNYITGIYPYSIMNSTFYPVYDNEHATKITFSSQDWCGQVYSQLNNHDKFEISSYSYFEKQGDENIKLDKAILENEIWNKIRISPESLPVGDIEIIPSFEYFRMSLSDLKAYKATAKITEKEGLSTYEINYPSLDRVIKINFSTSFPHTIESWSETFDDGYGKARKKMTTTATKIKSLKTPYWSQKSNIHLSLRDSLGL